MVPALLLVLTGLLLNQKLKTLPQSQLENDSGRM